MQGSFQLCGFECILGSHRTSIYKSDTEGLNNFWIKHQISPYEIHMAFFKSHKLEGCDIASRIITARKKMELLTFSDAIKNCKSKPRILLGNGFSQACFTNIFSYNSIFERANFKSLSVQASSAFDVLETSDFEIVMEGLIKAAKLADLYSANNELSQVFLRDANGLRESLVAAIAESHPAMPMEIAPERYKACRKFLSNFDKIYTVNYDLLLYWALMSEDPTDEEKITSIFDDGFRSSGNDKAEYVTWEIENSYNQNVFYLHGALHLFDAGSELQKFTWSKSGIRIIDQVREALGKNLYPVFVAEGTSISKLTRIKHSDYLSRAYRSLNGIGGNMFVHGHSLGDSDTHIFNAIARGKISNLYISIFGNEGSSQNQDIVEKGHALSQRRKNENPLNVYFYRAESANIWN